MAASSDRAMSGATTAKVGKYGGRVLSVVDLVIVGATEYSADSTNSKLTSNQVWTRVAAAVVLEGGGGLYGASIGGSLGVEAGLGCLGSEEVCIPVFAATGIIGGGYAGAGAGFIAKDLLFKLNPFGWFG
jgi:hypothetical protein